MEEALLDQGQQVSYRNAADNISIGVCSLKDLFDSEETFTLKIPDYQRPYVWDPEKVEALFKDLRDFYSSENQEPNYYLGTILLHQKKDSVYEIIDGQQRITTLFIIDYVINTGASLIEAQEDRLKLKYNSPISQESIKTNQKYISDNISTYLTQAQIDQLFNDLIFTIVITTSQDDAFTFFNTQNNRGIILSAVDFLKSYHLKALKGESEEIDKQRKAAQQWDHSNQDQFLDKLFRNYIWRGRKWKGRNIDFENKYKILDEFQKRTRQKCSDESITLFPNSKNKLATSLEFSARRGVNIRTAGISLQTQPKDFPFSFRQPIEKGMGFFLFTEKYHALYRFVFYGKHEDGSELKLLNDFYKEVYEASGFSHYLTDFFKLCTLLYLDKFEQEKLLAFCLWLDYLLGSYRIKQSSIVAQTPVRIVRDKSQNLLDVIESAYLPEEVIDFIQSITTHSDYQTAVSGPGVQGRYKKCLGLYYNQPESFELIDKKKWINAKLNNQ